MSGQHRPGPYWVRTATNGNHQVCGRHGATVREYMPHQADIAEADCRKLQAGFTKAEKAIHEAAPDLLAAAEAAEKLIDDMARFIGQMSLRDYALFNEAPMALRAAISKARGGAA